MIAYALAAAREVMTEDLARVLNEGGLRNDPAIIRAAAQFGRQLGRFQRPESQPQPKSEATMTTQSTAKQGETPEQAIQRLSEEANLALDQGNSVKANQLFAERTILNQQLHGAAPIVGGPGRSL